ncbi:MAG TPA: long-chain fatty acid--CoA ligase [Candidatus Hydrogenedentes bacterium]|nr:long-chain fatty acid--CoA ligase [Candidatus Hydrogenedentota bacterium]HQH51070.1 long-chain fatty acid--CoA ligase [Candidatus Hydrogenedentota bacterium]HQM47688.1 long-chain fatty acid--CoA ligase [Candidatus Hydrogenedentota bacterium]
MSLNLGHFLLLTAREKPDKIAVILDDYRFTYQEIAAYAKRIANIVQDHGVRPGDKVAMMISNTPHFPAVYFGILLAGGVVVPINCHLKSHEICYHLEDSEAKVFFTWVGFLDESVKAMKEASTCQHLLVISYPDDFEKPEQGESFNRLLRDASPEFDMVETMPDDTAVILYTSGTTGHPKGAELTHFNMFFNAFYTREYILHAKAEDVSLAVLPLYHSFGQTCVQNAILMAGGTMTMVPRFEAERVLDVVQRDRVSILAMVPTMYFWLLHEKDNGEYDLSSVRMAVSGGSALPVELLKRFEKEFGVRILEGYGLSETSPVASFNIIERPSKPGSIGLPVWGCEMRIMRGDGTFAGVGEVGEIVMRGHNVMKGYYKKGLATEEVFADGWFHTGDLARMDEDGYFFIVDRIKDLIIRSGMNIYPREVEETLYGHPAVLEAAVVGIPDEARGEEVKAFVAVKPNAAVSEDELKEYCFERMARFKCPKSIELVASLPKGPTGKILKRELRGLASSQPSA